MPDSDLHRDRLRQTIARVGQGRRACSGRWSNQPNDLRDARPDWMTPKALQRAERDESARIAYAYAYASNGDLEETPFFCQATILPPRLK